MTAETPVRLKIPTDNSPSRKPELVFVMENMPRENFKRRNSVRTIFLVLFLAAGCVVAYFIWNFFYKPNVPSSLANEFVQIPTGSTLDDVVEILKTGNFLLDEKSFRLVANQRGYNGRAGRFKIRAGWSSFQLVRHLRSGEQAPVKLVLVNERLLEEVAAKAARFIETDSASLMSAFSDTTYLDSIGYNSQTLMSVFIPNTYEFYWNTSARKFMERMLREHENFWKKNNRVAKADSIGLTKEEVYTLASIVERETNQNSEKPRLAGVYLNRLAKDWPLQADPTLVFVSRDWESRDLAQYKSLDSPYNTYKYPGLPPGPISMAGIPSLDAVLNAEKHDYMFFCAVGDGSGFHNFAVTLPAHNVNIEIYKRNLLKRNLGL